MEFAAYLDYMGVRLSMLGKAVTFRDHEWPHQLCT